MLASLSRSQLRHVFLHELSHLKSLDIGVNWLTALVQALHWFNPVVWLAFQRARAGMEHACHELVPIAILLILGLVFMVDARDEQGRTQSIGVLKALDTPQPAQTDRATPAGDAAIHMSRDAFVDLCSELRRLEASERGHKLLRVPLW